ncbi:sarcosine oxidase subunit alpha family protein [Jannaschia sp. Os4]|uniref:sarcosine oxidase subunit alpha family protein n=1 Tax=Jannaschia sp. Os4 TaxID=2807617 RepID=UPI0019394EE7|nr:sarcosine oxidase subunit alpha family protein [Jannaschia sp. Os4]MBM2576275.1 sarcosine oxidase subunit alpha family protein [Jannaschia sp. Os4]
MTARRLDAGGRIDRTRRIRFAWDGAEARGFAGDTLASALMASGHPVVGRSFKYHRPRGIMSAGVEESGAIVTVGEGARAEPNVKATAQELYEGLSARGQNAWPNVRWDAGSVSGLFGRFFAAGFYYKTFMGLPPFEWGRGTGLWMRYEALIRRAAGMGAASREPDPDAYETAHARCDVLVVGSGPAGLRAALTAAEAGRDVILVEQDFELGGDLLSDPSEWAARDEMVAALEKAGVRVMLRTTAFGLYDHGVAGLVERVTDHLAAPDPALPRQRVWTVRAGATVVATGALERTVAFAGNDRPGVMTAQAAATYATRFGVLPGERVVIAANNDSAYGPAAVLAGAGAEVTVLDLRDAPPDAPDGVTVRAGRTVAEAHGARGVTRVRMARPVRDGFAGAGWLDCDLLCMAAGWTPVVNLGSHRDVRATWDAGLATFLPGPSREALHFAGAAAGVWDRARCAASGEAAAKRAMGEAAPAPEPGGWERPIAPLYEVRVPDVTRKSFVDPQHDVTASDVRLAHREGFVSVEHLKRYTTLGMATDQGKVGNVIGLALMAEALGREIPAVGTTRFRPPYTPVSIGALAGRSVGTHFRPTRRTPLHDWNLAHGATMTDAGLWRRPWFYPRAGEGIAEAYVREAATVREAVGICDVSSLGKIAVQGPDAAEFLNRVYVNGFLKLPIGKARYGVMLRDDGFVMDDGTTWRLGEEEFLMTTTTTGAGRVMVWLEELLQTRWPELRVHVASTTDAWASVSVAGPRSRETIEACLADGSDISDAALPFMGVARMRLANGTEGWIARISFSGERAFELFVPALDGPGMMDLLWPEAERRGGCLYGLEALGTLRIEKGHVTGAELDGRVTLDDAGLGRMASTKKAFVGDALRRRSELERDDRPRLVGLFPKDRSATFKAGSILHAPGEAEGMGAGWVTAVTHSPALGHWIGLGFISGGAAAWDGRPAVADDPTRGGSCEVEVVSPHMFDADGGRMRG